MKIGIDTQADRGKVTGLGVYTKNLVQALFAKKRNGFEFHLFSSGQEGDLNTFRRLLWENRELPNRVKRDRMEILHIPAFAPPWVKPCKVVVTVHDLIGMIFQNQLGWPSRLYWSKWLPMMVKRADAIIADSENTKKDLVKHLHLPENRIRVIYPSGHEGFGPYASQQEIADLKKRFKVKENYFLAVGTLEPRKNLIRIIQAFSKFQKLNEDTVDYQLVIVGSTDFAHGEFFKRILKECAVKGDDIIFTGYLKHEDLNAFYSGATAFLFPSLYEGFGIPILEAMASGTAVLTSRLSSLPEVAGEAAFYVDPYDIDAMAHGMLSLARDASLREGLIERGYEQIKKFSWDRAAEETLEVYESVRND